MGKKRVIFESQVIDCDTGEVKSITTTSIVKSETFGMHRTTEGVEWVIEFQGKELQMLIVLNHFENVKTKIVNLSPLVRKELLSIFKITKSTLSNLFKNMEEKKQLLRLTSNDILLNPSYFYKGSSADIKHRIEEFHVEYDKKKNLQKTDIQQFEDNKTEKVVE
jgi:hypothetical protein